VHCTLSASAHRQVANLFGGGVDKLPLDEREQYVIDHMPDILDSVADPLGERGGKTWWQQAEDPWQCLAACFELVSAVQAPDPAAFMSRLPVQQVCFYQGPLRVVVRQVLTAPAQQDGSCNGLQHYAALSRDEDGGRAVNLLPGDRPADVYRCLAIVLCCIFSRHHPDANCFAGVSLILSAKR
jgi:DNA-directed RNA polymerase